MSSMSCSALFWTRVSGWLMLPGPVCSANPFFQEVVFSSHPLATSSHIKTRILDQPKIASLRRKKIEKKTQNKSFQVGPVWGSNQFRLTPQVSPRPPKNWFLFEFFQKLDIKYKFIYIYILLLLYIYINISTTLAKTWLFMGEKRFKRELNKWR